MKKFLTLISVLALLVSACSEDSIESNQEQIAVDLKTFVPDSAFDDSFNGKYVGYFGHHANRDLQGHVYINAGQYGQFEALVDFKQGGSLKFSGAPVSIDSSLMVFTGEAGSFELDLENFESNITAMVTLNSEDTQAYMVVRKAKSSGRMPVVLLGTYQETGNPAFNGDWNLMTDGTDVMTTQSVSLPGFPVPLDVTVTTQNLASLSITHTGIATPFTDGTYETNTAADCFDAIIPGLPIPTDPVVITQPIFVEFFGPSGGQGSISAGGQSSLINGNNASWNLTYNTAAGIPALGLDFPAGFYNEDCSAGTSGSWSWNGRSGTVTF